MCSTFKLLAAAAVLARVDAGEEKRVGSSGMSIEELCAAAMTISDNTAANLLVASLGGPAGLTSFARLLGDRVTRLDRIEPDLNEGAPDDPRDTTSPAAMASNLRALGLGDALSAESRKRLVGWLLGNTTGDGGYGPVFRRTGASATRPARARGLPTTSPSCGLQHARR